MSYRTVPSTHPRDQLFSYFVPFLLALYVLFPNLKGGDPRAAILLVSPEMLRLALGLGLVLLCTRRSERLRITPISSSLLAVWIWMACLAVPLFWSSFGEYAVGKMSNFYVHTLIAMAAPLFLLQDDHDLERFLDSLAVIGMLYGAFVGIQLLRSQGAISRYASGAPNPITVARSTSIALILLLIRWAYSQKGQTWKFVIATLFPLLFLAVSASRGPILAVVVAMAVWWACFFRDRVPARRLMKPLLLTLCGLLAIAGLLSSSEVVHRFSRLFTGEVGGSETGRMAAYKISVDTIATHPFGLGWGGFEQLDVWSEGMKLSYPHNMILEVALEGGLLALVIFLVGVTLAFVRGCRSARTPSQQVLVALLTAFFANAMVSGDLNTNRLFLVLTTLCLAGWDQAARRTAPNCAVTASFSSATTRPISARSKFV